VAQFISHIDLIRFEFISA